MSNPFHRQNILFPYGVGRGVQDSNDSSDIHESESEGAEDEDDQVVYAREDGLLKGSGRIANLSSSSLMAGSAGGKPKSNASDVTCMTTASVVRSVHDADSGPEQKMAARSHVVPGTSSATTHQAASPIPDLPHAAAPAPLIRRHHGSASLSSLSFASPSLGMAADGSAGVAGDVVSMNATVKVPPALRATAVRRTMLDIMLDVKKRKAEEKEEERRRVANLKEVTLTELFDKQQQQQRQKARVQIGEAAEAEERTVAAENVPRNKKTETNMDGTAEAAPADPQRSLRHLLPSHLRKVEREKEMERMLAERKQRAVEQEMAMDISDFGSSDDSVCEEGNARLTEERCVPAPPQSRRKDLAALLEDCENEEDERHASPRAAASPLDRSEGKTRSDRNKAKGTVLALLGEDEDGANQESRSQRNPRTSSAQTTTQQSHLQQKQRKQQQQQQQQQQTGRSVMDLFHAREVDATYTEESDRGTHATRPRGGTAGMRASDLVDAFFDQAEQQSQAQRQQAEETRRSGRTAPHVDLFRQLENDAHAADLPQHPRQNPDADGGPLHEHVEEEKALDNRRGPLSKRTVTELLDESMSDGAVHAARVHKAKQQEEQQHVRQQQWLRVQQELAQQSRLANDAAQRAAAPASMTGMGIVGKPLDVCITAIAAAPASSSSGYPAGTGRRCWHFSAESLSLLRPHAMAIPSGSGQPPHASYAADAILNSRRALLHDGQLMAITTTIPRLLTHPQQQQQQQQQPQGVAGRKRGGTSDPMHVKSVVDNPTSARVVEYVKRCFDTWLLDGGQILREIQHNAEVDAEAQARAAAHFLTPAGRASQQLLLASQQQQQQSQPPVAERHRSSLSTIISSALQHHEGSNPATPSAPPQPPQQEEQPSPQSIPVSLDGSGVDIKLRVAFADSAFGVTRIVGDVEWMSAAAQTKCGLASGMREENEETENGERGTMDGCSRRELGQGEALFTRKPDLQALEARRWTVVLPEHLFRTLPLSLGRSLYLALPFFVVPAAKTILSSYCVTTDMFVAASCKAYEALREEEQLAAAAQDAAKMARREAAEQERGISASPARVERFGTAHVFSAISAPQPSQTGATPEKHVGDEADYLTPQPQRRRFIGRGEGEEGDSSRHASGDAGPSAVGASRQAGAVRVKQEPGVHRGDPHVYFSEGEEENDDATSIAKTPFRGNLYDPLAIPGIAMGGANPRHSLPPSQDNGGREDTTLLEPFSNRILAEQTPPAWREQHGEDGGGGGGDHTRWTPHKTRLRTSQEVFALLQDRRSESRGRQDSSSQGKTGPRKNEEEEAAAWERLDPKGIGFPRGPGNDWSIPFEVMELFIRQGQRHQQQHQHQHQPVGPSEGDDVHAHGSSNAFPSATRTTTTTTTTTVTTVPSSTGTEPFSSSRPNGPLREAAELRHLTSDVSGYSFPLDEPLLVENEESDSALSSGDSLPSPHDNDSVRSGGMGRRSSAHRPRQAGGRTRGEEETSASAPIPTPPPQYRDVEL